MLMTANPHYDAECYENEQDLRATTAEALEIEAYGIAFAALGSKQASWFKEHDIGRGLFIAPDHVLSDAIGDDTEVTDAFDELMTDPCHAAVKFRQALASYIAKHYWRDIVGLPDDERDDV